MGEAERHLELNRKYLEEGERLHIVNSLHTNFYENWMTPEGAKGSEAVRELIEKLRP
ncbi:MAG: hypothetical protein AOA65_0560 [Candidatus Bathyarchaeota archaeon BA1]|nr:MAG: hypothetical protein AOA65_0560 [Candidatus Bathyarchaeota archaeon BA1]